MRREKPRRILRSLLAERHAVGALVLGGILLVGAHHDLIQRTVVLGVAVIGALADGAGDTLVGVAVHTIYLLFLSSPIVWPRKRKKYRFPARSD